MLTLSRSTPNGSFPLVIIPFQSVFIIDYEQKPIPNADFDCYIETERGYHLVWIGNVITTNMLIIGDSKYLNECIKQKEWNMRILNKSNNSKRRCINVSEKGWEFRKEFNNIVYDYIIKPQDLAYDKVSNSD